jgi:hypothetical protein
VDETYLKVGGQWVYLYRSVDKQGKTVESYLSRTRDVTAAVLQLWRLDLISGLLRCSDVPCPIDFRTVQVAPV